jgi:quercetin dioxygenase-like cupin family protein
VETPRVESFGELDLSREIPRGRIDLIRLGGLGFDRATFEPGWRWSEHAGAGSCGERHLGYLVSGCMGFRMDDGSGLEARAGDVYLIPPGHDAWVVGDEPCVALDIVLANGSTR